MLLKLWRLSIIHLPAADKRSNHLCKETDNYALLYNLKIDVINTLGSEILPIPNAFKAFIVNKIQGSKSFSTKDVKRMYFQSPCHSDGFY